MWRKVTRLFSGQVSRRGMMNTGDGCMHARTWRHVHVQQQVAASGNYSRAVTFGRQLTSDSSSHRRTEEGNIDYRCEDGRLMVSASCVTISNLDSLSTSETGNNSGIRSWKKHSSEWARCQKAIGGIYFTKKWRAETLQPGLEFDNFKPRLKSGIFKCIS
jgi:hypothetical protein